MAKLELKRISSKTAARIATIAVILVSIAAIVAMIVFLYRTMNKIATASFTLSEVDQEAIETIDLAGIEALQSRLNQKNALDEPRAGRPHNPFADIVFRHETATPSEETVPEPDQEETEDAAGTDAESPAEEPATTPDAAAEDPPAGNEEEPALPEPTAPEPEPTPPAQQ